MIGRPGAALLGVGAVLFGLGAVRLGLVEGFMRWYFEPPLCTADSSSMAGGLMVDLLAGMVVAAVFTLPFKLLLHGRVFDEGIISSSLNIRLFNC